MLEALQIDYLGVSIDALLIIAPADDAQSIARTIRDAGVAVDEIGRVEEGTGAELHVDGQITDFTPRFRESAYTPIKKAIGESAERDVAEMSGLVDLAARKAVEKKRRFVQRIRKN
jgi:hydrogenase expression/formation protein